MAWSEIMKGTSRNSDYTAAIQRDGKWWIGWIEEVPGVNAQARSRRELLSDLRLALKEALDMNRSEARAATNGAYEEVRIKA
jgi:predicted RNase H-like HicB family nuclease